MIHACASIKRSKVQICIIKKNSTISKTSTQTHFIRDHHKKKKVREEKKRKRKRGKRVLLAVVSSSGALGEALGMAAVPVCV